MSNLNRNGHGRVISPFAGPVNRIEDLFGRVFGDDGFAAQVVPSATWGGPPITVWQDEDHIVVEAELPGVADADLEVVVHDGILYIRGERKPVEGRKYLFNNRTFGKFERAISLPDLVNAEAVEAELKHGILQVALPKSPAAKPKRIALKTS
jgi:HSP20 family protein